jgi:protein-disulfide isomerase
MNKAFWAVIAAIIVIFGGILLFKSSNANTPSSSSAKPTHHVEGKGTTGVVLVEYGDYQCPFCGQYYLIQLHQNAFAAARAAEAADMQGKFWEMHDMLYENQNAWSANPKSLTVFEGYAQRLGLNVTQFRKDFGSSAVNDRINADIIEFDKTKQEKGTPTFFLDGKKIKPTSLDEFSKLIDQAIADKQKPANSSPSTNN